MQYFGFALSHKMKMKCSGAGCRHVYEYDDVEFPLINDNGLAVFKCPECNVLTAALVRNVDVLKNREDVVYVCEPEYEELSEKYAGVARGEFKEYDGEAAVDRIALRPEPVWSDGNRDYEAEGRRVIDSQKDEIAKELSTLRNGYLAGVAGADDIDRLEIRVGLTDRKCRFMKAVKSENDFTVDGLTLVEVEGLDPAAMINGIYTRDRCMAVLDGMLRRWQLLCREVFLVSPFIGFQYNNEKCKREIRAFWNWLGQVVDIKKARFITRKNTFTTLRKAYDDTDTPLDERIGWHDVSDLIAEASVYDGRKEEFRNSRLKFFQQSHAKFYAGVFDDYVEMLIGSFNIHSGEYRENLTFMRCPIEKFEQDFLKPYGVTVTKGTEGANGEGLVAVIETSAEGTVRCRVLQTPHKCGP